MNDADLLRYSRQIMLPWLGIDGQNRLRDSRVLIVGLGGLGSPVAMYLAAAGIGRLTLADFDTVDLSNLQRQLLHTTTDIGRSKAASAADTLAALNPDCVVTLHTDRLDAQALDTLAPAVDAVIDCSDNFATRHAINQACVTARTPLISGAAIRMEGQVGVFINTAGSPCYRCLYPRDGELEDTCSTNGVLAPVPGIIGSIQATEAIKVLTGYGEPLTSRLLLLDATDMTWRTIRLVQDPACPVCGPTNA